MNQEIWLRLYLWTLFAWVTAFAFGPVFTLINGMIRNGAVLIDLLPAEKHNERVESWILLPAVSYVVSVTSGIGVTLAFSVNYDLGFTSFALGLLLVVVLGTAGMFLNSNRNRLRNITSPAIFVAELKYRRDNDALTSEDVDEARAQLSKLDVEREPPWRRRIRENLSDHFRLDPNSVPKRLGTGKWHDLDGKEVKITSAMICQALLRNLVVWLAWALLIVHLSFCAVLISTLSASRSSGYLLFAITLFVTVFLMIGTGWCGARTALIAGIREQLVQHNRRSEINRILSDAEKRHQVDTQVTQEPERQQSIFDEVCEVLLRRLIERRKPRPTGRCP